MKVPRTYNMKVPQYEGCMLQSSIDRQTVKTEKLLAA